jgi:chorismate synthase
MKLFKKKATADKLKATNSTITKLDKNQLGTIIGGETTGQPIGGIIVKGGRNPGGQL